MKSEFLHQNVKKDKGYINYSVTLLLMIFVVLVVMYQVQVHAYSSSSQGLEDAIVDAALASAVPDLVELGKSGNLSLYSATQDNVSDRLNHSWQMFVSSLSAELKLDENMIPQNKALYGEKITINDYRIYNVIDGIVYVWQRSGNNIISTGSFPVGSVNAPNGIPIIKTSIYVDLSSKIEGYFDMQIDANKKKLVAIDNR